MAIDWRIGCSGWSYQHWRGDFYPAGMPASRWFAHYAACFGTVELNNPFYRTPSRQTFEKWAAAAPEGFTFAVKMSRGVTHFRRLKDAGEATTAFIEKARGLGKHLGPILYQMPAAFARDDARLAAFLDVLPRDLLHVFEFRHPSWRDDRVYELLRAHGAVWCAYNMGDDTAPLVRTGADVYIRMHGPAATYASGYTDAALREWIDGVRAMHRVERAWVYFNNDGGGHAPRDAMRMRQLIKCGR
jgi:uncharacterized protein YecE (DUF72 family)